MSLVMCLICQKKKDIVFKKKMITREIRKLSILRNSAFETSEFKDASDDLLLFKN